MEKRRRLFETEAQVLYNLGTHDRIPQLFIQPQFDEAYGFSEGMAVVKSQGKYGYVRNPLN